MPLKVVIWEFEPCLSSWQKQEQEFEGHGVCDGDEVYWLHN